MAQGWVKDNVLLEWLLKVCW